ncbi:hypothetical protein HMPREF1008_01209 [Olsenella sp. oral taxon 809 str. F0356]|uniref:glycosyltransferase n=1 Tax=Olsenella sp. oral taxon 809 TaxID=661086 RepID=UPI000231EE1B|nr:glycosyltransferase [Olsenella sp. oral taxon 809]EHF01585.1 hypothetical protein HMPREF1008_01209 [Olsenella sp. oral taxon 809 str. F0356]
MAEVANVKLANVLLDESVQFLQEPTLLHRSTALVRRAEGEGPEAWALEGPGTHDFTTFFNALSVSKWRSYTVAKEFFLHLEAKGAAFRLLQSRADVFSWDVELVGGSELDVPASDEWHSVELRMENSDEDVIESFVIVQEGEGPVFIRNAHYFASVPADGLHDVELALCTTTFRKEEYVERNVELAKTRILASDEPIATHFTMHIVDNGRSLDAERLQAERVRVHPNDNVGGSGGYARGMIEALGQRPKATHVILMDDDVLISPESILRTYNLLRIVSDDHAQDFVSGAMMDLFEPDVRWEDTGFVTFSGDCVPLKPALRMGQLHSVVANEAMGAHPELSGSEDQSQQYGGWWYCVIPVTAIERHGLPLPLFVRYDDIEYALRCRARFMTMNGICLWHPSFVRRYSAAVERYQVTRNSLVAQYATGVAPQSDFLRKAYHLVQLELKKFNYTNAELVLDALEDFLKGPAFLEERGRTERAFMEANRRAERLLPFPELRRQAEEEGIDLSLIAQVDAQKDSDVVERRSLRQRLEDFATFNGQRLDLGYVQRGSSAIIDVAGWLYPADQIRRKDTIVAVDLENQRGVIRHMDRQRFRAVWERYKRDAKEIERNGDRLREEYAEASRRFVTQGFWRGYLGID